MKAKIQLRNDTAANWRLQNPVLDVGELGIETDTKKIKIGDGVKTWNSLPYMGGDYNALINKPIIPTNNNQLANGAGYITEDADILGKAQFADCLLDSANPNRLIEVNGDLMELPDPWRYVNANWTGCAIWNVEGTGFEGRGQLARISWAEAARLINEAIPIEESRAHIINLGELSEHVDRKIANLPAPKVNQLSDLSSKIGLLRTTSRGGRLEIKDDLIQVYDDNNRLRVRIGKW